MGDDRSRVTQALVYFGLAPDPSGAPEPFAWTLRTISLFALQTVIMVLAFWALDGGSFLYALSFGAIFVVSMLVLITIRARRDRGNA